MSEHNDGGPAFPFPVMHGSDAPRGMTLRDYFAAKAMQGFASSWWQIESAPLFDALALDAYEMADAMLEARNA